METNLLNTYVLKALDAYPYDLEETVENLNYALSYQEDNVYALFLMGKLQAEQFGDYEKAKNYYAETLAINMNFHKVYSSYITVLLWNEDLEEAQKLIDFALTVKGLSKSDIWALQGQLFEQDQKLKKALKSFKTAKLLTYNNDFTSFIDSETSRIKAKIKSSSSKKCKKKTSNKKRKKKKK